MKLSLILAFLLTFFIQLNLIAQNAHTKKKIRLVEKSLIGPVQSEVPNKWTIKERMAHYKINGLSIAIVKDFKIEFVKGYGWSDEALKIPVTEKTLFQAGSVSKSLNAVAVLKLVQDKKLDLYEDINQYLTSWKFPYDSLAKNKKITVANLLSHTAGLNVSGFSGYTNNSKIPSIIQILDGKEPANSPAIRSVVEPNTRHEYSGGGTTISQLIVMDATRQPYDEFLNENVLKPLGMTRSTFSQPSIHSDKLLHATGYDETGKEYQGKFHIYPEQAAAGLWTTPSDLAKFIIEIQKAYQGKSNKILQPDMVKLMLTPHIDRQAALGVFINDLNGVKYFGHSGLTYGFQSQYYGSFEDGNGVVIMTNSVNDGIIPEIVNSVAKVYQFKGLYRSKAEKTVTVDEVVLQSYTGQYVLTPEAILTVSKEGNQLYVQLTGQEKIPVFSETENKFYLKVVDAQLEFIKDEKGKITKVILNQDGGSNEASRIK